MVNAAEDETADFRDAVPAVTDCEETFGEDSSNVG
jgi:hypothetical protein